MTTKMTPADRFWSRVNRTDGCWEWLGFVDDNGYGRSKVNGTTVLSHRFAYTFAKGAIPDGLTIDHLCRNRRCVRPDHLEAVTSRENTLRGQTVASQNAKKTHCKHGHEFTPANTYVYFRRGMRIRSCRACNLRYTRQRREPSVEGAVA